MLSISTILSTSSFALWCLVILSPFETSAFSSVKTQLRYGCGCGCGCGHRTQHHLLHYREGATAPKRRTKVSSLLGTINDNDSDMDRDDSIRETIQDYSSSSSSSSSNSNSNNSDRQNNAEELATKGVTSRRRMISSIAAGVLTSGLVTRHLKHAFAEYSYSYSYTNSNANANANGNVNADVNSNVANAATLPPSLGTAEHPVAIVGGSGRTGMAVAESLADPSFGNMHALTLTRSGRDPFRIVKLPQATKEHLAHESEPFDVRDSQETILANLRAVSPSVVVYAASASRQGGNASEVDDEGVEKVARACEELGALFVLISALAVDRPDSKSFQITNTLGGNYQGIMDAKNRGEAKTRAIFASSSKGASYVIVRPGVLLGGKSATGPSGIELNQGDTIGGGLSRDELAGIVVGAIQSRAASNGNNNKKSGGGITVEAYRRSTAQKLEKRYEIPSGNELTIDASLAAATPGSQSRLLYRELFARAKPDETIG